MKYLLGQLASLLGRVQDLVVEHREVEGQTQPDGVGGLHLLLGDLEGLLVGLLRLLEDGFAVVARGNLGEVSEGKMFKLKSVETLPQLGSYL